MHSTTLSELHHRILCNIVFIRSYHWGILKTDMLKWEHLIIIDQKNSFPQFSRLLPNEEMTKSWCQLGVFLAVACQGASARGRAYQGPAVCTVGLFSGLHLTVDKIIGGVTNIYQKVQ